MNLSDTHTGIICKVFPALLPLKLFFQMKPKLFWKQSLFSSSSKDRLKNEMIQLIIGKYKSTKIIELISKYFNKYCVWRTYLKRITKYRYKTSFSWAAPSSEQLPIGDLKMLPSFETHHMYEGLSPNHGLCMLCAHNIVVIWNYFGKDWSQFLKKNIFFTQGSHLWFSGNLSTSFWAKVLFLS